MSVATAAYDRVNSAAARLDDLREWDHVRELARAEGIGPLVEACTRQMDRIASERDAKRFGLDDLKFPSPLGAREAWIRRAERHDESDAPRGIALIYSTAGEWGVGEIDQWFDAAGPRGKGWRVADVTWMNEDEAHDTFAELTDSEAA